jgi:hypothetical protein
MRLRLDEGFKVLNKAIERLQAGLLRQEQRPPSGFCQELLHLLPLLPRPPSVLLHHLPKILFVEHSFFENIVGRDDLMAM